MRWELRETELERTIVTMEKNTAEIAGAASKVGISKWMSRIVSFFSFYVVRSSF